MENKIVESNICFNLDVANIAGVHSMSHGNLLDKNATSYIEQILEATLFETIDV